MVNIKDGMIINSSLFTVTIKRVKNMVNLSPGFVMESPK